MDERYNKYEQFCENIEEAYRKVCYAQMDNYDEMEKAENTGDDETLDKLNVRADELTAKAEKLLHLRSHSGEIFDYVELMRECDIKF